VRSVFAALRSLVLPAGATSGQRIILNGVTGRIEIYDSAGVLRALVQPQSPEFSVYDSAGDLLAAINDSAGSDDGVLQVRTPDGATTDLAISTHQESDTGYRWQVRGDGTLVWDDGDSTGGSDVRLTRSTTPNLSLVVSEDFTWNGASYTAYTPTWATDGGTQPTVANATRFGRYKIYGRMVHYYGYLEKGSSSTNGTGNFKLGLPIQASSNAALERFPHGTAWIRDVSVPDDYPTGLVIISSDQDTFSIRGADIVGAPTSSLWSGTVPFTFQTGDWVGWNFVYERVQPIGP
jgi:hypothetical protein